MHRIRSVIVLAVLAAVAALTLSATGLAAPQAAPAKKLPTTKVSVSATEYAFKFSRNSAPRGTVIFSIKNNGTITHDLVFAGSGKATPVIAPGKTYVLKVTFLKKGSYQYICSIGEHAFHGMSGNFTIK